MLSKEVFRGPPASLLARRSRGDRWDRHVKGRDVTCKLARSSVGQRKTATSRCSAEEVPPAVICLLSRWGHRDTHLRAARKARPSFMSKRRERERKQRKGTHRPGPSKLLPTTATPAARSSSTSQDTENKQLNVGFGVTQRHHHKNKGAHSDYRGSDFVNRAVCTVLPKRQQTAKISEKCLSLFV